MHMVGSKVLHAGIGKYVTMARKDRNSDEGYVSSITNEESRPLELNLSFLNDNRNYKAEIYAGREGAEYRTNPDLFRISSEEVKSNTQMKLQLAPGGGAAIRMVPVQ